VREERTPDITGTVSDSGGGYVTVFVDRDTFSYSGEGSRALVIVVNEPDHPEPRWWKIYRAMRWLGLVD
jgi:hypothetical protein